MSEVLCIHVLINISTNLLQCLLLASDDVWLLDFSDVNVGLINQFAHLFEISVELGQTCLVTLHHFCKLAINVILSTLNIEIIHPCLIQALATNSSCLWSLGHASTTTHQESLLLGRSIGGQMGYGLFQLIQITLRFYKFDLKLCITLFKTFVVFCYIS